MKKTVLFFLALFLSVGMVITSLAWAQLLKQPAPLPTLVNRKIVFITSQKYNGALGGGSGADAKCQALAAAAGLSGTFKAWLSYNVGTTWYSPVNTFTHNDGPYVLRDGRVIADNWNSLVSGTLRTQININQIGKFVDPTGTNHKVWTGTRGDGYHFVDVKMGGNQCQHHSIYTSSWFNGTDSVYGLVGYWGNTNAYWTAAIYTKCDSEARLYCFQQ